MPAAVPVREVSTVCPYCGVGCGLILQVENERVSGVRGNPAHPANFGRLCTKGATVAETIHVPGRLTSAQTRLSREHTFAPIGTEEALDQVAEEIRTTLETHGPDAVAFYISGQLSTETQYLANKLAKGFLRTNHIDSNSRLCMASAAAGYKLVFGADAPPGHYEDFEHADVFFVAGANPADCHPVLHQRLRRRMRESGAKLIVVDPRRTATSADATLHLALQPGTDLALLHGLLHLLVKMERLDREFIAKHTEGWEALAALLETFPPARVAALTGLAVDDLIAAARMLGEAHALVSLWTMGLNQSTHGTAHTLALCHLHLATGQIGRPGAGPFSLTGQPNAMGGREVGYMSGGLPGQRSVNDPLDRAEIEALWSLPAGSIRDRPGHDAVALFRAINAGQIKFLWVIGTNPALSMPNAAEVRRALASVDTLVVQETYAGTETAQHAHIVLPGSLWCEADGTYVNSSRMLTPAPRAIAPPGAACADWEMICGVARRLGHGPAFAYRDAAQVFAEIRRSANPRTGYALPDFSDAPVPTWGGIRRYAGHRFATPNGRARFVPRDFAPPAEVADEEYPFTLLTGRTANQWHTRTKTGLVPALNKLDPAPFLELNEEDAVRLGVSAGDPVRLVSRRGEAVLPARPTDAVAPGVCWAPMHWDDAAAINLVTSDATDADSKQPELKCCAVALVRVAAPAAKKQLAAAALNASDLPIAPAAGLPYLPETAPFTEEQRMWLNGFLAGWLTGGPAVPLPAVPEAPKRTLQIAFGSQTGNAEGIAKKLRASAEKSGFAPKLTELNALALDASVPLLILTSTWGEGDPPDNASDFWDKLGSGVHPRLDGLRYSVLALGDPNYEQYCGFGKKLDARLAALGAHALVPRCDCDTQFEAPAAAWIATALAAFERATDETPAAEKFSKDNPFPSQVLVNRALCAPGSAKDTRHYVLSLAGSGLRYEPGDVLGLLPENAPAAVEEILRALGCDGEEEVPGASGAATSLRLALTRDYAIRPASRVLAERLRPDLSKPELDAWIGGRELIDLLLETDTKPSPAELAGALRKLTPRLYSIASSQKAHPDEVHLCVDTVRYETHGRERAGVASVYLAERTGGEIRVPLWIQTAKHFRLPADPGRPIIMIGPGTGIAPFRAFLEERAVTGARGANWLFFGAPHAASEFFYRDEMEAWQRDGVLARLDLAFSRDQAEKVYVQHRLLEQAPEIWRWLEEGAHFYVCGDAARMAKDVDAALHVVIRHAGEKTEDQAREYVAALKKAGRYQRDVY